MDAEPTTRKRRTTRPMVALDPSRTVKYLTHRHGATRMEIWEAYSADGEWMFEREESTGTPWVTFHIPTSTVVEVNTSLNKARESVARGWAQASLERDSA